MLRRITIMMIASCVLLLGVAVSAQAEQAYVVQPGDTLTGIADRFGISLDALLIRNNLIDPNSIQRGTTLTIPLANFAGPMVHVVQPSERLTDLAIRYNTTVDELVELNRLGNRNLITRSQEIMLPGGTVAVGGEGTRTQPITYVVQPGDTLSGIAAQFGTTASILAAVNGIAHPDLIFVGQQIVIPASGGPIVIHPPQPEQPILHPPAQPVVHPQPPIVHTPSNRVYIVQRGDYLERIAHLFGVTVEGIRQLNGIVNNRLIFPGDRLLIPPAVHPVQPVLPRQVVNGRYTVQPGDTLLAIAQDFGVDVYNLARANGIFNLNLIYAGQALHIPIH